MKKSDKGGLVIRSESSQYIDCNKRNEFGNHAELIYYKGLFEKNGILGYPYLIPNELRKLR